MDGTEKFQIIDKRDIYTRSSDDVPKNMKLLESIKNRPLAYTGLSIFALTVFLIAAPQYWIALTIAIAFCIVVFLLVKNDPILDIYEEFIVCHKRGSPTRSASSQMGISFTGKSYPTTPRSSKSISSTSITPIMRFA